MVLAWVFAGQCCGCLGITRQEVAVKNAFIMYQQNADTLDPPGADQQRSIDSGIGRAKFVSTLLPYVTTKYRREALYAIAWFGGPEETEVLMNALADDDAEVRRIALRGLENVTQQRFATPEEALAWRKARGR